MTPNHKKLAYLEALRGIAAVIVAMFHFELLSPLSDNLFVRNGEVMVDFFFVLSGFVIGLNYFHKIHDLNTLISFQLKRLRRLYPLHFVCLIGFLCIEIAKYCFEMKAGIVPNHPAFSDSNLSAFVQNLLLTQALFLQKLSFNYPSWSISVEFYSYCLFAFVALCCAPYSRLATFFISAISFFIIWHFGAISSTTGLAFFRCTYSFFLGAFLYSIAAPHQRSDFYSKLSYIFLFAVVVCVSTPDYVPKILLPLLFAGLIGSLFLSLPTTYLMKLLHNQWLIHLGTISYGIYMLHAGVWWGVTQILRFVIAVPTYLAEDGSTKLQLNFWEASIVMVCTLSIIIVLASLSYRYFETRFQTPSAKFG